jgi:translation initiation factor IF-1
MASRLRRSYGASSLCVVSHEADRIVLDGIVTALHRGSCDVTLKNGRTVRAFLAGRLMLHKIRVLPGDRVEVEMTPFDLTKGRITYRFK